MKKIRSTIAPLIGILFLCGGWQFFALIAHQSELVPTLPKLLQTLGELACTKAFYQSIGMTIARGLEGMLLSITFAITTACICARFKIINEALRPLLAFTRSIPVISFILLALIFMEANHIPVLIAFLTMFPLLTENLTRGISAFRPELSTMAHQFQIAHHNLLFQIYYPQLKPFLFSGLASAAGFGWRTIIMGEVLAQCTHGIGGEMKRAQNFIDIPTLLAWTIVATIVSFLFDKGINWLANLNSNIIFTKEKQDISPAPIDTLNAKNISYQYGVQNFSYCFQKENIYGISAPSGKGKTTLLHLLGGIFNPLSGAIQPQIKFGVATIFQAPELLTHLSAEENIMLPLASFMNAEKAQEIAHLYLKKMGMEALGKRLPETLSYGQQQRIAIARALAYPSPLLLMDEPFKGLDENVRSHIIECIKKERTGRIIIFTSHNPEEMKSLADKVIYL